MHQNDVGRLQQLDVVLGVCVVHVRREGNVLDGHLTVDHLALAHGYRLGLVNYFFGQCSLH